jgi:hypothetical protein
MKKAVRLISRHIGEEHDSKPGQNEQAAPARPPDHTGSQPDQKDGGLKYVQCRSAFDIHTLVMPSE